MTLRTSAIAVAAAGVALALALAAGASTTTRTVFLTLPGAHAKAPGKCGDAHADPYSAVARDVRLTVVGTVRPIPTRPNWQVRFSVKRCVNHTYRQVRTGKAIGHPSGVFRFQYTPRHNGLYIMIADYGRHPHVTSPKLRLRAR